MKRARTPAPEPQRTFAEVWLDGLLDCLLKHRAELHGNPEPAEIAERLLRIVRKLKAMAEIEPIQREEHNLLVDMLLADEFFPDAAQAMKKALEPCFDVVDEAIAGMDATGRIIDLAFMREMYRKACEIATRKAFLKLQEEARARLAAKAAKG